MAGTGSGDFDKYAAMVFERAACSVAMKPHSTRCRTLTPGASGTRLTLMTRVSVVLFTVVTLLAAEKIDPSDVKIAGDLDYGQTSSAIEYTGTPKYGALLFTGNGGDRIEVRVTGSDRKTWIAIANGALEQLATGTDRLTFELPQTGPDAEAYYILFRDPDGRNAKFTVELKKLGTA
jgi:hypothetical protein